MSLLQFFARIVAPPFVCAGWGAGALSVDLTFLVLTQGASWVWVRVGTHSVALFCVAFLCCVLLCFALLCFALLSSPEGPFLIVHFSPYVFTPGAIWVRVRAFLFLCSIVFCFAFLCRVLLRFASFWFALSCFALLPWPDAGGFLSCHLAPYVFT